MVERRRQYSLRNLFLIVTVSALACGTLSWLGPSGVAAIGVILFLLVCILMLTAILCAIVVLLASPIIALLVHLPKQPFRRETTSDPPPHQFDAWIHRQS